MWDAEIELYYARMRYYDPHRGRFVSDDPIGFAAGTNFTQYVLNRPTGAIDPTGTNTWSVQAGRVGVAVGGAIGGPVGAIVGGVLVTTGAVAVGWYGPRIVDWTNTYFTKPPDNAYDPNGPKAPGRPSKENGFEPPKKGDQWVKEPNGSRKGWQDKDGNVWVPSGPRGHGGPHWDVEFPNGGYQNVFPGSCLIK